MYFRLLLASLPAALGIVFAPHFCKLTAITATSGLGRYNNVEPRKGQAEYDTNFGRSAAFIRRCQACHNNGIESFTFYAAAVLSAYVARAHPTKALRLAARYVLGRVLYTIFYLGGTNFPVSVLRTFTFFDNMNCIFKLLFLAAKAVPED